MFEYAVGRGSIGTRVKKNPELEMQNLILLKKDEIPSGMDFTSFIPKGFVGKIAIAYQKDNVGQSGGNAQWCFIYDCVDGQIRYIGTAIHKCADPDIPDQNYNEKLYSILGRIIYDPDLIKCALIDLVPNIVHRIVRNKEDSNEYDLIETQEYPSGKPAVLSYNVVKREPDEGESLEEMIIMKTIVFNVMERQEMYNSRAPLTEILKGIEKQLFKKVQFERKKVKRIIMDAILSKQIADQMGEHSDITDDQTELLTCISEQLELIDENSTLEGFSQLISELMGKNVTGEEIENISISGQSLSSILEHIKTVAESKRKNYIEVERGIIQITAVDLITNSIDRHLNNWALIRDKRTDRYTIGIFDHATAFTNLSLSNNPVPYMRGPFSTQWEQSSVLLDRDRDRKVEGSRGSDVFQYIMENYREYVIEILQILHDKLPEFERHISYELVPEGEFKKLSADEQKQFFSSNIGIPILPQKIINGIKSKFKEIEQKYDVCLDPNGREDD